MKVVAVQKDGNGTIQAYQLEDGSIVDHEEAVDLVENGILDGYNIATAKDGTLSIRSNRDGDTSNNLDSLPAF